MEILGYISFIVMGVTLGLLGAGGSILTIPILVYLCGMPIRLATGYSLFLVGMSALIAAISYRKHIHFKKATYFTISSILGVFISRHILIPNAPQTMWSIPFDKALVGLLLFFIVISGYTMIKGPICKSSETDNQPINRSPLYIMLIALALGIIMGLLGAGGGFLIIPALVFFMGFGMSEAVPTSLMIITLNSFIGFIADKQPLLMSDWLNLGKYLIFSISGMFIGLYLTRFIQGAHLKKAFGYFIWVMGLAILIREFIF